jgi:hypothetical protein
MRKISKLFLTFISTIGVFTASSTGAQIPASSGNNRPAERALQDILQNSGSMQHFYGAQPRLRPLPIEQINLYNFAAEQHKKELPALQKWISAYTGSLLALCPDDFSQLKGMSITQTFTTVAGISKISAVIDLCALSAANRVTLKTNREKITAALQIYMNSESQLADWHKQLSAR